MADKRISDLNLHTTLELSDSLPIINNGETKKTTYGSLYYGIREGLATTGSNIFIGNQTISGSLFIGGTTEFDGNLVPKIPQGATLGTAERPFRELFLQSGSISIESDAPGEPPAIISNKNANLQVSIGGMKLVQSGSSFISPTGSFDYISANGYTKFGDASDDRHEFTGSVYISGSIHDVNSITFNSSSIPTTLPNYTLAANLTDKTLDLRMGNNATLQLGQEMYYPPIVNKSGEDLLDGDLVMINPAGVAQGNRISVVKAIGDGTYPADYIVGVLTQDIAHNAEGFATWFGYVRNISKTHLQPAGETWVEGNILYPNPTIPGKMTNIEPSAPALKSKIAAITSINGNNVTLLVRPQLGGNLGDLHNVNVASTQTGSILYNSGSVWRATNNIKIQNGYVILSQVSSSLNYANDTTAGAAGVPLGGLYHTSGSIKIRLV